MFILYHTSTYYYYYNYILPQDVVFPSVTICNLNQVEASFLKKLNISGFKGKMDVLMKEFMHGHQGNTSLEHNQTKNEIESLLDLDWNSFLQLSSQSCDNLFTSFTFHGVHQSWGPDIWDWAFSSKTDFGACCSIYPHFKQKDFDNNNVTSSEYWSKLEAGPMDGDGDGLNLLIDAEQFNYAYFKSNAPGFKISLHHHRDQPMMQFSSNLITPGTETEINVKPKIISTTERAIMKFSPEERNCYTDGEAHLNHLYYEDGYRYEMGNCLTDEKITDIIWNCRCLPKIWQDCYDCEDNQFHNTMRMLPFCTGKNLYCANARMKSIGLRKMKKIDDIVVDEALENPNMIENITKPEPHNCLKGCFIQENKHKISSAPYPQRHVFFYQRSFCDVASHIWKNTCQDKNRKTLLGKLQPNLCSTLDDFTEYFGNITRCEDWPDNFFETHSEPNGVLLDELYQYGRDNLVQLNVVIQTPYVTKIKRDVSMTFTSFVANTGGLLGLFVGFSFISGIEMLFWFFYGLYIHYRNITATDL